MYGISERFRNYKWASDPFIGFDKFPKDIIITLLQQREMQYQITLIRTLIVILGKIQLIITGVDIILYRQVSSIRISIL